MSNDPATNVLAAQIAYGEDEIQKMVDERIEKIVERVVIRMLNDSEVTRRIIVNNTYDFNAQVIRAVKDFYQNPRQIY